MEQISIIPSESPLYPLPQNRENNETTTLEPPQLRSPLYSADAMILLCPLLVDSISTSLPQDAWDWESTVVSNLQKADTTLTNSSSNTVVNDNQSTVSSSLSERKEDKAAFEATLSNLQKDKRGYIICNLYETERNYVRDLDIIINIFRRKLVEEQIVPDIAIRNIFCGMDELHELHTTFLSSLEDLLAVDSWDTNVTAVGKLFVEQTDKFDGYYTKFIDSYALSQKEMKSLEGDNPAYVKFLAELAKLKEANRQSLKELLITPVQRTTRYHLFLKDLDKATGDDHPDKEDIKKAWDVMTNLAKVVNKKKRREEERTGLFEAHELTKNCPPTLINSRRRMVMDVDVTEVKSNKSFHLFLCSDLLMVTTNIKSSGVLSGIIGKESDKLYKFVKNLELKDIVLEELPENVISLDSQSFKFEGYEANKNRKNFLLTFHSTVKGFKDNTNDSLQASMKGMSLNQ